MSLLDQIAEEYAALKGGNANVQNWIRAFTQMKDKRDELAEAFKRECDSADKYGKELGAEIVQLRVERDAAVAAKHNALDELAANKRLEAIRKMQANRDVSLSKLQSELAVERKSNASLREQLEIMRKHHVKLLHETQLMRDRYMR